ncbi:MAG: 4-hydroxy-tetrahydrodipicolinate reductase [Acidaminococcales bacterium]|jgi:4-hydroxy-tetrahydrodipicolinate reductase|nr:4-hydroxy-tetrahydrodipicolinate reductase [Acidaminococcales bacterium]
MLAVLVNGALGRMGREVLKAVSAESDMRLAGAVDIAASGENVADIINIKSDLVVENDLEKVLADKNPQVVVDFTLPDAVMGNLRVILAQGVRAVVGTTGFSKDDLAELERLARDNSTAVLIAPNFSVGANIMMRLAEAAAKFLPQAEIIELHHDKKMDAPSGTAIATAERVVRARGGCVKQGHPDEREKLAGARGAKIAGVRIHSVRLPGYVAHQEIIFGGLGETLVIRHDSNSRECFMPGVILACRAIAKYNGLIYGLDQIMG